MSMSNLLTLELYFRATWRTFQPKLEKIKKNPPRKKFLIFQEMELLSSNIKKIQETETPKKNPYISGNVNPNKVSYISGNGTFQSTPQKISYISGKGNPEKNLYISGNGNPEKILILPETELPYISGNVTFLYFGKGIFRTLAYLELEEYSEPGHI